MVLLILAGCPSTNDPIQSIEKTITAFSFTDPEVMREIIGTAITATVPYGTDVIELVATFTTSGTSVIVNGTTHTSGSTSNDFTNEVKYIIKAENGSMQDYMLIITKVANTAQAITAFSFTDSEVTGEIAGTIITVTVPYDTVVTGLVATFTSSGTSVTVNNIPQTSGSTSNDFTDDVKYIVIAENGTKQIYTATVIKTVGISAISGITVPVLGEAAVTTITETDQYTGTVSWDGGLA